MLIVPLPLHVHGSLESPCGHHCGRQVGKHTLKMFIQECATYKNKNSKKAQKGGHTHRHTHTHGDKYDLHFCVRRLDWPIGLHTRAFKVGE